MKKIFFCFVTVLLLAGFLFSHAYDCKYDLFYGDKQMTICFKSGYVYRLANQDGNIEDWEHCGTFTLFPTSCGPEDIKFTVNGMIFFGKYNLNGGITGHGVVTIEKIRKVSLFVAVRRCDNDSEN